MAMIADPLPCVTEVRYVRDHVLWLRFRDGVEGEVDFEGRLHGALLGPLRDVDLFARARAHDGFVVWPNGADSSPEVLYERVLAAKGIDRQAIDDAWAGELAHISGMPELSRFFGIVITMLPDGHSPPHFHAKYGEHAISMIIRNGEIVGRFPSRALRLVLEWRELHEAALMANWNRLHAGQPAEPIPPLD
ncbi:MAG: DUF4160 domain-containing protein [Gemmatimonadaceae bacterium]